MVRYGYYMADSRLRVPKPETVFIARAISPAIGFVPSGIHLSEDQKWLHWKIPPTTSAANWIRPTDRMLVSFARISSPRDVLRFASRYGVFGLYELKPDAPGYPDEIGYDGKRWSFWSASIEPAVSPEPVGFWLELASRVAAILRIRVSLDQAPRRIAARSDWSLINLDEAEGLTADDAEFLLAGEVNWWLSTSRIRFEVQWPGAGGRWRSALSLGNGYTLFPALALQLMLTITGAESLYQCSGCNWPYPRIRKAPNRGSANYCDDCGTARALKDADKRRKDRMAEARRLHAAGESIRVISQALDAKVATVRRWVTKRKH